MQLRSVVRAAGIAVFVLAVLVIVFMGHVLFPRSGEALPGSDFREIHYPLLAFVTEAVHDTGELPLWNPHQYLGYSVVGNSQYGLFYPPNWILLLARGTAIYRAVGWLVTLHVFWHALGLTALARLYGAGLWPAIFAGVIGAFGGTFAARIYAGHYALILTAAWTPWIMAGYRLAALHVRPWWALPGAIALALGTLSGHPQTLYVTLLGVAIQWAYDLLTAPTHALRWQQTRQLVILGMVGAVLSAVTWLPALDYAAKTTRGTEQGSLAFANEHALPANALLAWIVPDLFGDPQGGALPYWLDTPLPEELLGYAGLLPLLLVFYPLKARRRWLFAALVLAGVLLSLGTEGGLFTMQHRLLPPVRNFRAPGRALLLTSTGLALLAALALTDLANRARAERAQALAVLNTRVVPAGIVLLFSTAAALAVVAALVDGTTQAHAQDLGAACALSGLFLVLSGLALRAWIADPVQIGRGVALAVTLIVIVLDVWHVTLPLVETRPVALSQVWEDARDVVPLPADSDYARVMQTVPPGGIPNGASWTGYHSFQGYDPLTPALWFDLVRITDWSPNTAVSRMVGVRYIFSGFALDGVEGLVELESASPYRFYENPDALPRAYLARRYEYVPDSDLLLQRIALGHVDSGEVALLSSDPFCPIADDTGSATITEYTPNRVTVEVMQDGPGLLVLADQYDDDWTVRVDGSGVDLLRANYVMRAVCVPAGTHTVTFEYRPWAYRVGRSVSAAGWALLLAGGLAAAAWRWRTRRNTP